MARLLELTNASYHVINRGDQRATVFHDDWHYDQFINKLGCFATEFHVEVYAYCCMPNHFHHYWKTKGVNLSRFMQSLLTSFCVSSNRKRRTSGHIFQGRFKAHLVEDDGYRSRLPLYPTLILFVLKRFEKPALKSVTMLFVSTGGQVNDHRHRPVA